MDRTIEYHGKKCSAYGWQEGEYQHPLEGLAPEAEMKEEIAKMGLEGPLQPGQVSFTSDITIPMGETFRVRDQEFEVTWSQIRKHRAQKKVSAPAEAPEN